MKAWIIWLSCMTLVFMMLSFVTKGDKSEKHVKRMLICFILSVVLSNIWLAAETVELYDSVKSPKTLNT